MIQFEMRRDCDYKYDYAKILADIGENPSKEGLAIYRALILDDLFFIVCFVMGIEKANHPFVVKMCRMVEEGPKSGTQDVWARGHFKSTIITVAETLQYHLRNPKHCTCILAYARPAAKKFLRSIMKLCEESAILKAAFPDVIPANPRLDSKKWSEDDGICFLGANPARGESTIEAWGLTEGMPTGRHYERRVFDDLETEDIQDSPEMLDKVFSKFQMANNLGTMSDTDIERVIGTYYNHAGPNVRIGNMADPVTSEKLYLLRKIPATDDGTATGTPVYMDELTFNKARAGRHFNSQQLCDPTPQAERKIKGDYLRPIDPNFIPRDIIKIMVIDPAGDQDTQKTGRDCWGISLFGVKSDLGDVGASDVYLLDAELQKYSVTAAVEAAVRMYLRGGVIQKVGVEKVGQSSFDLHLANALKAYGRQISVENETLVILKPAKREKKQKIIDAIEWPLNNGKLWYSTNVKEDVVARIKAEMDKFPFWHDDGIETFAYLYDILADYKFQVQQKKKPLRYNFRGIA